MVCRPFLEVNMYCSIILITDNSYVVEGKFIVNVIISTFNSLDGLLILNPVTIIQEVTVVE